MKIQYSSVAIVIVLVLVQKQNTVQQRFGGVEDDVTIIDIPVFFV
jgi:hypothetical protein